MSMGKTISCSFGMQHGPVLSLSFLDVYGLKEWKKLTLALQGSSTVSPEEDIMKLFSSSLMKKPS
jgi:hypothetical protein